MRTELQSAGCLCPKHARAIGRIAELEEEIVRLKARVSHLHIHDNKGNADTHGAIGDGTIDFAPVYDLIKKGGAFPILEADSFDGVLRSITQFKRNGIE